MQMFSQLDGIQLFKLVTVSFTTATTGGQRDRKMSGAQLSTFPLIGFEVGSLLSMKWTCFSETKSQDNLGH